IQPTMFQQKLSFHQYKPKLVQGLPPKRILQRRAKSALQLRPKLRHHPSNIAGPTSINISADDGSTGTTDMGDGGVSVISTSAPIPANDSLASGSKRTKPSTTRISIFFGKVRYGRFSL